MKLQFKKLMAHVVNGAHASAFEEVSKHEPIQWSKQCDPLHPYFASVNHRGVTFFFCKNEAGDITWSDVDDQ